MSDNKKRYLIIYLLILFLMLSTNTISAENSKNNLPDKLSSILKSTKIKEDIDILEAKDEFKDFLYEYDDFENQIPQDKIINVRTGRKPYLLSKKKLIEDTEYLFKIFKYGYAGYQYFGGDAKFNKAKENIIEKIERKSIFSLLTTKAYIEILRRNLDFVQDLHFAIEGESLGDRYYYFMSDEYNFKKDDKGYYTNLEGKKYYLTSINEENNFQKYLKLSLDEQGKIIYRIGRVAKNRSENIELNIKLENNDDKRVINKETELLLVRGKGIKNKVPYNVYEKDGIPIIEHRNAAANSKNREQLEKFVDKAPEFKDEEYFIIDIRGNSGGSDTYARDWVKNLTGQKPNSGMISANLVTETANTLLLKTLRKFYEMENEKIKEEYGFLFNETNTGWTRVKMDAFKSISNDNIIIVLIDKNVASAGESFIEYLKQLENVIFIGTNTAGLVNFGNLGICNLPNSKIELFVTKTISLKFDLQLDEGKGYYPDFWVDPSKALDVSFKFLDRYFRK